MLHRREMEAAVSYSMGAIGPVRRKLDLLLAPESQLRKRVKDGIGLLKEDLEEVSSALVDLSMLETPGLRAKCWMEEARELSYQIEDFIDDIMPMRRDGDADAKIRSILRHRAGRVKISRLPKPPRRRRSTRMAKIAELRALLRQASERLERYQLDTCCRSLKITGHQYHYHRAPALHGDAGNLVGIEDSRIKLIEMLSAEAEQQLKAISIVGPAGVGKTTLAKEIFRELGWQFELRAFVRASRNLDMRRFLGSILSQVGQDHELPSVAGPVQSLIDNIQEQLQDKRYFIVIDDLWEETSWDIISGAFPKVNNCSRIVATTEIMNVALKCCSYMPDNVFKMKPLGIEDSRSLFLSRVFGSEQQCPDELKEVSYDIVKKCVGLPLVLINLAGFLSRQLDYSELWYHVHDHLCSILNRSHTVQEIQEKILNLSYNSLPNCLKTCLLYFSMYPENYVIWKVHLVKQWIAEGFIDATEGKDIDETAENYFEELVSRGMIQPMETYYNDEVLSCTVHHIIHDLISHNSKEEEFIAAIDYSQNITRHSTKALRLSFRFSSAKYAKKPVGITMSQLRSIGFFGFLKCLPPIEEFKHLRVLIFDVWGTHGREMSLNLSRICILLQLRYLKISSDTIVELPAQMQQLNYLETLDIDARVSAVPLDIVYLPSLLHLGLRDAVKLPDGIGRIKSLSTLSYFDLRCNSEDNIWSLGKLTNLRCLHLTCSAAMSSDHLKRKLIPLASSLGKLGNLKSLTLTPDAIRTSIFFDISSGISSPSIFLQRLELLPPICLFSRLPPWIAELHKLRILKIMVKELRGNDINNIAGLPSLVVFSLYVHTALTGTVIFSNMAFPALKYFKFTCGVMCLAFQAGAMPNLQRLKLCFNAHKGESNSRLLGGIGHLLNLREVSGRIGECPGSDGSKSRAVKSSLEETIRMHPRCPRFKLQLVDFIEEEYPPLDKLHQRQQEGLPVEHGIIIEEDCAEDPNKHVDSRFFEQFGIPSASGTSCHLKSGKVNNMMAAELAQYSNITLGEGNEICDIMHELKALRKKILSLDFDNSMHVHDPQDSFEYLDVLCKIRRLSERLRTLDPGVDAKQLDELTVYADELNEMTMAKLEEEFVYLLTHYKHPLQQEDLSFRFTEDGSVEDSSSSSLSEEQSEGRATPNDISGGLEYFVPDLIQPGALSAVKSIAKFMFLNGYDKECSEAYMNSRQSAIDEYFGSLRLDKLSVEELMNTSWSKLNPLIKRWNQAMRVFIRLYLASEKRLSHLVFGELTDSTADLCFNEISFNSVMQLLKFYVSVAICPPKVEMLFRLLDMYEVLNDLLPEAESLFESGYDDMVLNEYHEALLQLGESARKTFAVFQYAIQSHTSFNTVARGEVQPLTKYVMNYIKALTAYSKTLDSVLKETDKTYMHLASDIQLMSNSYPSFTATTLHLQSVAAVLEANLEAGSRLYRDDRLQNIFMMNNIHYMVQKVKNSDLKSFFGDDWIRVHNRKFQQQAMRYERASWNIVLSYLSDDGLCAAGDAPSRKTIREKIKNFNMSFEEVYRVQTAWSVPDDQLRDDVRISISLKVIQAYRTFVGRFSNFLDGTRHRDCYLKYRPEDLETLLLDLFEGTQKSL